LFISKASSPKKLCTDFYLTFCIGWNWLDLNRKVTKINWTMSEIVNFLIFSPLNFVLHIYSEINTYQYLCLWSAVNRADVAKFYPNILLFRTCCFIHWAQLRWNLISVASFPPQEQEIMGSNPTYMDAGVLGLFILKLCAYFANLQV
jgi:hypothetical protein